MSGDGGGGRGTLGMTCRICLFSFLHGQRRTSSERGETERCVCVCVTLLKKSSMLKMMCSYMALSFFMMLIFSCKNAKIDTKAVISPSF